MALKSLRPSLPLHSHLKTSYTSANQPKANDLARSRLRIPQNPPLPTASTDSFILDVIIMSERHQRVAARCVEDIVVYDYKAGKKTALRPFMVEAFREAFKLQEEARVINYERVKGLLEDVRALEAETWDKEGAVEDMGGKS